jgi:hypothetical protein
MTTPVGVRVKIDAKPLMPRKTTCEDLIGIVESKKTDGGFKELPKGTIA